MSNQLNDKIKAMKDEVARLEAELERNHVNEINSYIKTAMARADADVAQMSDAFVLRPDGRDGHYIHSFQTERYHFHMNELTRAAGLRI